MCSLRDGSCSALYFFLSKFFYVSLNNKKHRAGIGPKLIFFDGSSELGQDRAQRERESERDRG